MTPKSHSTARKIQLQQKDNFLAKKCEYGTRGRWDRQMNDPAKRNRAGQEREVHHQAQECRQARHNRGPSWDFAGANPCFNACRKFRISGGEPSQRQRRRGGPGNAMGGNIPKLIFLIK